MPYSAVSLRAACVISCDLLHAMKRIFKLFAIGTAALLPALALAQQSAGGSASGSGTSVTSGGTQNTEEGKAPGRNQTDTGRQQSTGSQQATPAQSGTRAQRAGVQQGTGVRGAPVSSKAREFRGAPASSKAREFRGPPVSSRAQAFRGPPATLASSPTMWMNRRSHIYWANISETAVSAGCDPAFACGSRVATRTRRSSKNPRQAIRRVRPGGRRSGTCPCPDAPK